MSAIAEPTYVSRNTVKSQTLAIYGKLGPRPDMRRRRTPASSSRRPRRLNISSHTVLPVRPLASRLG